MKLYPRCARIGDKFAPLLLVANGMGDLLGQFQLNETVDNYDRAIEVAKMGIEEYALSGRMVFVFEKMRNAVVP